MGNVPAAGLAHRAQELLGVLAGQRAMLRDDQLAAIQALVVERRRAVVVKRTGWGKSAVYFLATRLLRDAGAGPSLLVSPLLSLMRDQIAKAEAIGIRAATINSTNLDQWRVVEAELAAGGVDLLLISPERLNNPQFRTQVLPDLAKRVGLLVIDEAHCISDWGHDFRPDYRRLVRVLDDLDPGIPVLACTATANERVMADVAEQLGATPLLFRGSLDRESLRLSVLTIPSQADRMAWLAEHLPRLEGSGIVYCLTVGDADRVAGWLRAIGIDARAYSGRTDPADRLEIEDALRADQVKVVVAPRLWAWALTSPTWRSWSISSRRTRRSPTTSRSAGPAGPWTGLRWCCCAGPRTAPSGSGSPPPPSHPATRSPPSWGRWRRGGRCRPGCWRRSPT
jgi:ATP-dependent DNA helicase RecQ